MKYWGPINSPGGINGNDGYVNGNPSTGTQGSIPTFQAFEQTLRELANLVIASGLTPDAILNGIQVAQSVQAGKVSYGVATGGPNAYATTLTPIPGGLTTGMRVWFSATTANAAGGVTLNVNSTSAIAVQRMDGSPLQPGDIVAGNRVNGVVYNGTSWQLFTVTPQQVKQLAFLVSRTVFSTPGAYSFTIPANITTVRARIWGAGGGGGYGAAGSPGGAASGGGGGGFTGITLAVTPGGTITGVIGTGGVGSSSAGNDGASGTATTAISGATTYTSGGGTGGKTAVAGVAQSAQVGGGTTNGDNTSATGQISRNGFFSHNGTLSNANGGDGGLSPGAGGFGGSGGVGPGNAGLIPGGGGAGGGGQTGTAVAGGNGAAGSVWLEY